MQYFYRRNFYLLPGAIMPFKKGQSGNPLGRAKGGPPRPLITPAIRKFLGWKWLKIKTLADNPIRLDTLTGAEVLALRMLSLAQKGNASILAQILDRIDGKIAAPPESLIGVQPLRLEIITAEKSDANKITSQTA
jgi:hypothetical protein